VSELVTAENLTDEQAMYHLRQVVADPASSSSTADEAARDVNYAFRMCGLLPSFVLDARRRIAAAINARRGGEEQVAVAKPTKKQRLAQRADIAKEFALDSIDADGSFLDAVPINGDGDPGHESGGSCWITLRVKVADTTIEKELTCTRRARRERGEG
jgi:hypothetical protein